MVFYRKYRPQKIDDLDSASVREMLHAVLHENTPHAFLFTGPKGLGKTSTARIVAKVVNCETPVKKRENGLEPCNTCNQCLSITEGTNVDVLEIDAASNCGIDEIRELKEKIRLAPVAAKRKVYIIDEVHMLTTEAFNALLKTLEEPPSHAMFILCTTEAHKVPETIVSRCFQIQFRPATEEELVRSFTRIVEGEKLKIDDEALKYIAQLADRGFRDGVKVLEEVSLLSQDKPITKEFIENTYKTMTVGIYVFGLLDALEKKEVKEGLKVVQAIGDQGIDSKYVISHVLELLHEYLLEKVDVLKPEKPSKQSFSLQEIKQLADLFAKVYLEMKTSVLPQLPLELAIIEWCESVPTEQGKKTDSVKSYVAEDSEVSVSSLRKQVGTMKKIKALYGEKKAE